MKQKLLDEITKKIEKRKKWENSDFMTSQILLWLAVVSSFITAIVAVNDTTSKWVTATLAAISGMIILIDKNFSFAKRATWNTLYRIKLERLYINLEYAIDEPTIIKGIAEQLQDLQENMEREFPNAIFQIQETALTPPTLDLQVPTALNT